MAGPCTGLTVLDFSLGMPGAICTLVMADYGAEVIKVEPPGGDPYRFQPAWISWNRGKKGHCAGSQHCRRPRASHPASGPGRCSGGILPSGRHGRLGARVWHPGAPLPAAGLLLHHGLWAKGPAPPGKRVRGRRCGQSRPDAQPAGTAQPGRPCVFGGVHWYLARQPGCSARNHWSPPRA